MYNRKKKKLNCKFLNETFKTFVSFKYKILPQLLTKSNHEEKYYPTYRSQKGVFVRSHQESMENTFEPNFQKVIRHKHCPLGVLKFSFHTEIFVNTEETLSYAQFTLISTVITGVPSRSFHIHSLVCLPRFPAGACLFQLKNKRQKRIYKKLYQSFWSDWHKRTLDKKSVSEILKEVLCFQTEWDTKKKCTD